MTDQWPALTSATTAAGCWRHLVTGQSDCGAPPTRTPWWYSRLWITTLPLNLIVPLKSRFVWFMVELMYWTMYRKVIYTKTNLHLRAFPGLFPFLPPDWFLLIFPTVHFLFTSLSCRFLLFPSFSTSFMFSPALCWLPVLASNTKLSVLSDSSL